MCLVLKKNVLNFKSKYNKLFLQTYCSTRLISVLASCCPVWRHFISPFLYLICQLRTTMEYITIFLPFFCLVPSKHLVLCSITFSYLLLNWRHNFSFQFLASFYFISVAVLIIVFCRIFVSFSFCCFSSIDISSEEEIRTW